MEGETGEKVALDGNSSTQGFSKVTPNYHHQSQHHQRSPSMDHNRHHHLHHQHHAKPPLSVHQHYHLKAPGHYERNESNGTSGEFSSYPPPPDNASQNGSLSHYNPHYAPYPRSTTPGVRSVVTHSFSMEEEQREDGSSRYCGGHHRSQNRDPSNYLPDEYRSPATEFHLDRSSDQHQQREPQERVFELQPKLAQPHFNNRRDFLYGNGHELPPVLEEHENLLPSRVLSRRSREHNALDQVQPSPHAETLVSTIERSLSSVSTGGPLKRSFWHHSRPFQAAFANEEYGNDGTMSTLSSLPREFMPPKRTKTSSSDFRGPAGSPKREEYIVTVRSQGSCSNRYQQQQQQQQQQQEQEQHQPLDNGRENGNIGSLTGSRSSPPAAGLSPTDGWYSSRSRSMSWETREDYYRRDPRSALSWSSRSPNGRDGPAPLSNVSGPQWMGAPYMPSPRSRHSNEGNHYDIPLQSWEASQQEWGHHPNFHQHQQQYSSHLPYIAWSGINNGKNGDHIQRDRNSEKKFLRQDQEHVGFGSEQQQHSAMHFVDRSVPPQPHGIGPILGSPMPTSSGVEPSSMITGQTLDIIDSNGRDLLNKNEPVKLLALPEDRISLSETLCIVRENVEVFTATIEDVEAPAPGRKHAVTVGQVGLRCIHCRHTTRSSERVKRAVCYPSSIKRIYRTVIDMKLDHFLHCKFVPQNLKDTLQALKANNTRSTGTTMQYFIRAATTLGMVDGPSGVRIADSAIPTPIMSQNPPNSSSGAKSKLRISTPISSKSKGLAFAKVNKELRNSEKGSESSSSGDLRIHRTSSTSSEGTLQASETTGDSDAPQELFTGSIPLSVPEDKMSLSPLRCFLRQQVCAFSATEEDIAVRTPTTFAVSVGQVGIGCIHCLGQPAKLRLNRAVCFPFSIARIYQSVADIQRFHLSECKKVPKDIREKFLLLQSQSSKGSKGLATRQYWVTSAKKIGLVDTSKGIRFSRDPAVPAKKAVSLDILAQVASNVTTVNRPLVLPEDKPYIAEFLYVVMGQLQPCRFTEADRNKRRLKDVGCIGVECKHCAGQVDGRKFFWSSVNAVESNFVSVHTHMMECRMVPKEIKENLAELKKLRKEQTAALKTGSQKAFFARVWKRLHEEPKKEKDEITIDQKVIPGGRDEADHNEKTFGVSLSHDTLDSSIQMTPTASPANTKIPFTEIDSGKLSPGSPDSDKKIEAVSDKMAMAGI